VFKPPAKDGAAGQIKTLGDYVTRVQQYEEEFVSPKKKLSFDEWAASKGMLDNDVWSLGELEECWNASRENV